MRTERTNAYTTTLIIENFADSTDRGNYTCLVGDTPAYHFTRQIALDNIFEPSPQVDGPDVGVPDGDGPGIDMPTAGA